MTITEKILLIDIESLNKFLHFGCQNHTQRTYIQKQKCYF